MLETRDPPPPPYLLALGIEGTDTRVEACTNRIRAGLATKEEKQLLLDLSIASGASRVEKFDPSVTHILCGANEEKQGKYAFSDSSFLEGPQGNACICCLDCKDPSNPPSPKDPPTAETCILTRPYWSSANAASTNAAKPCVR